MAPLLRGPAPVDQRGAKIRARGLNGIDETIEQDGEWGIFRLFEVGQVRGSAELRAPSRSCGTCATRTSTSASTFAPRAARTPSSASPETTPRRDRYLSPFRGDYITPPHPIARSGRPCNLSGVASTGGAPSGRHHRRRH
ncbi:MAG: hypothetical protein V9F00_02600 [Nocardioides sp.]